jgi:hypothetical protein
MFPQIVTQDQWSRLNFYKECKGFIGTYFPIPVIKLGTTLRLQQLRLAAAIGSLATLQDFEFAT